MAVITKWSNVSVSVQSALAVAKTITAITKASQGSVSSTAHGYTNGDYVMLSVQGMYQLNYRVFRVSGVTTDAFLLEGEDTTSYATFVSGSAQKITFGTSLCYPSKFWFESLWDRADAGLFSLKSASDSQAQRAILFGFANGQKFVFNGYVGASLAPTGSAQDLIKTNVTFTALGGPKAYAS